MQAMWQSHGLKHRLGGQLSAAFHVLFESHCGDKSFDKEAGEGWEAFLGFDSPLNHIGPFV